jgi:chromate transport protein ChrA
LGNTGNEGGLVATPINILAGIIIIISIPDIFCRLSSKRGVLALAYTIPAILMGLLLDIIIQIFSRKYFMNGHH